MFFILTNLKGVNFFFLRRTQPKKTFPAASVESGITVLLLAQFRFVFLRVARSVRRGKRRLFQLIRTFAR